MPATAICRALPSIKKRKVWVLLSIQNEIQVKKQANATFSFPQPKQTLKDKFKNFFRGDKEKEKSKASVISYEESFLSTQSDRSEEAWSVE